MVIQWYPGHMTKARRMLEENLKLIDVVIELVDARAPQSTRNPDFDALFSTKDRMIILNKSDLADPNQNKKWIQYYKSQGMLAIEFVSIDAKKRKAALELIELAAKERVERMRKKGVTKTVRAMVVGIPNVGKSTFINRIAGGAKAAVGDKPGVTRAKQWVKISPYLELMDTPGLLWPKLENQVLATHLAYIGSIKDDIMDVESLAMSLLGELAKEYDKQLLKRYPYIDPKLENTQLLDALCKGRGFLLPGGEFDRERGARILLDEFRAGRIANVTLDKAGAAIVKPVVKKDEAD